MRVVEIKTNQMKKAKVIYSEFAVARESATTICLLAHTQRQVEGWERLEWIREGFGCA